jgi:hypothetical protein
LYANDYHHSVFVGTLAPALRFGKQTDEESVFAKYRIDGKAGVLVLVRPDGHMSVVDELSATGIKNIKDFLAI